MITVKKFLVLLLVFVIGVAWIGAESYWIGLSARWFLVLFMFPYGTPALRMHILSVLSTLLVQLFPSLIAAWLISLIKPWRWALYSIVFLVPEIIFTLVFFVKAGQMPYWHSVDRLAWFGLGECLLLVQVPVLLLLIYKLDGRWKRKNRRTVPLQQPDS
ncbi:MAG: hypothetical protein ACRETQ_11760 [Gammaproteobacteria bacterium]